MVPQQSQDLGSAILQTEIDPKENDLMSVDDHEEKLTVFGSQLVVATSNTPYTDATQVSIQLFYCFVYFCLIIKAFSIFSLEKCSEALYQKHRNSQSNIKIQFHQIIQKKKKI